MKKPQKEIELNFYEVTPAQYGKLLTPPVSAATIVNRCNQGLLNAYRTEGGHWKIRIPRNESITTDEYEKLKDENVRLRSALGSIKLLANSINI